MTTILFQKTYGFTMLQQEPNNSRYPRSPKSLWLFYGELAWLIETSKPVRANIIKSPYYIYKTFWIISSRKPE